MQELNDIKRRELAEGLTHYLADTYLVFNQAQNFHWNIESPFFRSRHLLFEDQYKELFEAIDTIAERIRMLGFYTPGTLIQLQQMATVVQSNERLSGNEMLDTLTRQHEHLVESARKLIRMASDQDDESTADLLVQRLRAHEKFVWILRSHRDHESEPLADTMARSAEVFVG